jgi:hypothetical protein
MRSFRKQGALAEQASMDQLLLDLFFHIQSIQLLILLAYGSSFRIGSVFEHAAFHINPKENELG